MSTTGTTSRPRLSVAVIAHEISEHVAATIRSVGDHADECVVLVYSDSEFAKTHGDLRGARIVAGQWRDDFAATRNECLRHITGDWVLWLDPGETIDAAPLQALREFMDSAANPTSAYTLFVRIPAAIGQIAAEQSAQIRLHPRSADVRFAGRLRESLVTSLKNAGLDIEELPFSISRPTRDRPVGLGGWHEDLRISERWLSEDADSPAAHLSRADALHALGRADEAIEAYRRAVAECESGTTDMLEGYYGLLAAHDADPTRREMQLAVCLKALEVFPLDAQLLSAMGTYMLAQNRADLAVRSYQIACDHGHVDPMCWHLADLPEVTAACLALALQMAGRDTEAREHLEDSLEKSPGSVRLRRHLINLHIKHRRGADALAEFERFPLNVLHRGALRRAIVGAIAAANHDWEPAKKDLAAAYDAGCRDPICLRSLAIAHLTLGDLSAAGPILSQWREIEPGNQEVATLTNALAAYQSMRGHAAESQPAASEQDRRLRVDTPPEKPPVVAPTVDRTPQRPLGVWQSGQ